MNLPLWPEAKSRNQGIEFLPNHLQPSGLCTSMVSSINKKACLLACLLENSTKFTQPLILETYSKPLYSSDYSGFHSVCRNVLIKVFKYQYGCSVKVAPAVDVRNECAISQNFVFSTLRQAEKRCTSRKSSVSCESPTLLKEAKLPMYSTQLKGED